MPPKRKASAAGLAAPAPARTKRPIPLPTDAASTAPPPSMSPKRRASARAAAKITESTNPQQNEEILDAPDALRASPDSDIDMRITPGQVAKGDESDLSSLSEEAEPQPSPAKKKQRVAPAKQDKAKPQVNGAVQAANATTPKKAPTKASANADEGMAGDPEAEDAENGEADEEELKQALSRPPPVNSDYLPLPWKGRIGYACLNTYLRFSTPPVFSSRTCRIASIIEHRHPLRDPSQPEHAAKNRPDKEKPADVARGQKYVEEIGLANARDLVKMLRWNERYGIRFMRLSSEMFPFASHDEYGYKLEPFAAEVLEEVGKVVAELGHRVTTHPGQFTQLGSPRKSVIEGAIRDLEYHDEMLSLLKLPPQQNRDAVMIMHMGGVFGDKAATLDRFRENYAKLSPSIKARLVLENDDVSWSVHELLPVCEELNIPLVLDYHHHNIIFDKTQIREGTKDIMELYPRISKTWTRKNIKQKMHYSEPTPAAITPMQRRKHSPRVATLPPCAQDMDLMIEAKDKEQAVFELMRNFKLPGFDSFTDMIPHVRNDDNKAYAQQQSRPKKATPKKAKGKKKVKDDEDALSAAEDALEAEAEAAVELKPVPEEEFGMGGPEGRVYWPPGMEDWLRPKKREVTKKEKAPEPDGPKVMTPAIKRTAAAADLAESKGMKLTPAQKRARRAVAEIEAAGHSAAEAEEAAVKLEGADGSANGAATPAKKKTKAAPAKERKKKEVKAAPTPSTSNEEEDASEPSDLSDEEDAVPLKPAAKPTAGARKSGRTGKAKVSYAEPELTE